MLHAALAVPGLGSMEAFQIGDPEFENPFELSFRILRDWCIGPWRFDGDERAGGDLGEARRGEIGVREGGGGENGGGIGDGSGKVKKLGTGV